MLYFSTYCFFCAGPLDDAYTSWLEYLGEPDKPHPSDGWKENLARFPVPTKLREDIVTITDVDGAFWRDWVMVGPFWKGSEYVSPPCVGHEDGIPRIQDGEDTTWFNTSGPLLCVHRGCLSFIRRSLHISPAALWEAFHCDHAAFANIPQPPGPTHPLSGLLTSVKYYDIEGRQGQYFEYARECYSRTEDGSEIIWYNPASMDDCQWLLARPTAFPKLKRVAMRHTTLPSTTPPLVLQVFAISELFDLCLSFLKSRRPSSTDLEEFTPHPEVFYALISLSKCSRRLYALVLGQQNMFYRLVLDSGWMLPLCPADWAEWKARGNPVPLPIVPECDDWDWRAYLVVCARGKNPHMRNRARFRRMTVQFASPTKFISRDGTEQSWNVGQLEEGTMFSESEPEAWEVHEERPR